MQIHRTRLLATASVVALVTAALAWAGTEAKTVRSESTAATGSAGSMPIFSLGEPKGVGEEYRTLLRHEYDKTAEPDLDAVAEIYPRRHSVTDYQVFAVASDGSRTRVAAGWVPIVLFEVFRKNIAVEPLNEVPLASADSWEAFPAIRLTVQAFDVERFPPNVASARFLQVELGEGTGLNDTGDFPDEGHELVGTVIVDLADEVGMFEADEATRESLHDEPQVDIRGSMPIFAVSSLQRLGKSSTMPSFTITLAADAQSQAAAVFVSGRTVRYYDSNGALVTTACNEAENLFDQYNPTSGQLAEVTPTSNGFDAVETTIHLQSEAYWGPKMSTCPADRAKIEYAEVTLIIAPPSATTAPNPSGKDSAILRIDVKP